jgi:hypothetical protein
VRLGNQPTNCHFCHSEFLAHASSCAMISYTAKFKLRGFSSSYVYRSHEYHATRNALIYAVGNCMLVTIICQSVNCLIADPPQCSNIAGPLIIRSHPKDRHKFEKNWSSGYQEEVKGIVSKLTIKFWVS